VEQSAVGYGSSWSWCHLAAVRFLVTEMLLLLLLLLLMMMMILRMKLMMILMMSRSHAILALPHHSLLDEADRSMCDDVITQ